MTHGNGVVRARQCDAASQLTDWLISWAPQQSLEDANFTYQYDNNGNLTRKTSKTGGPLTTYEYDAENKLARATVNGTIADYKYDALGRRAEKQVADGPTTTVTRFIYDVDDILLEVDGSNNITARYTHGPGIDEPLVMEKNSQSFFYHADGLGSIAEITNQSGSVVQQYTYSSFGKLESQLDANFVQPYAFTAREFDPENGLYFHRERTYSAAGGRFLQEDPIRFNGGMNFYTYALNDPVNLIDPFGLSPECPDCVDKCLKDNYGDLADYAYTASIFGFASVAGLELAAYSVGIKFGVLGGLGASADIASRAVGHQGANVLSSPAANYGRYFGIYGRAVAAQRAFSFAEGLRTVSNLAFKAARGLGVVGAAATVGGTSFYGTAWLYCQFQCVGN